MPIENNNIPDFKNFFLSYKDKVYKYALLHLKEEDTSADLVQEAFSRIWKKWGELDGNKNPQSYLYTIAKNLVFDELRKQKVRVQFKLDRIDGSKQVDNSNEESIRFKDLERVYREAIEKLPKARLEIFLLSKEEFLDNQEIADRLGISVNTVRDQLVKGNKFVRQYILDNFEISTALLIFLTIF
ncbi:RNA polymerase sigma factor [Sphingobacterium sp. BIGb0165]|uniref:RNA polymerase sigma factor n=1 Tax=Sphingobacterium sp. BIGb0165 TaxID=2940615 RepID=UPI002166EF4C|nr:RNA polymerase sigma-70 factor [Sphingobacterium sp. BIGb0165]MCS4228360.1 RNA polymerase sigma-70 factor (ECF subfamily) [Sphingobacterium sp. BIGb0165]